MATLIMRFLFIFYHCEVRHTSGQKENWRLGESQKLAGWQVESGRARGLGGWKNVNFLLCSILSSTYRRGTDPVEFELPDRVLPTIPVQLSQTDVLSRNRPNLAPYDSYRWWGNDCETYCKKEQKNIKHKNKKSTLKKLRGKTFFAFTILFS